MLTLLLVFSPIYLHFVDGENCSLASSCYTCLLKHPSCYWCTSSDVSSGCIKFNNDAVADMFCPSLWIHNTNVCPLDHSLDSTVTRSISNMVLNRRNSPHYFQVTTRETKNKDLQELLHKLLLLKLLRKIKSEGSLTEKEKDLLYSLRQRIRLNMASATTTITPTTRKIIPIKTDVDMELAELLKMLRNEEHKLKASKAGDKSTNQIVSLQLKSSLKSSVKAAPTIPTSKSGVEITANSQKESGASAQASLVTEKMSSSQKGNHVENGSVKYEEKAEESIEQFANKLRHKKINATIKAIVGSKTIHVIADMSYCKLYEENTLCNSDHNCTWCNTLDICIQRNDRDYKKCVSNAKNLVDSEYGLDRCFSSKNCKECVRDEKCYWCDMSQRCHTYPFFGYVPNSCGGDWYVKQCDVQLAIIIVALPLVIILIAMLTFYFCLKYCHYRRKVLRVPLFEKPGVFDYRKDKKVYFVNPEDESGDDELVKENIRKKYRLPAEKEPLIDPNT